MSNYRTPGVYVEEISKFPPSVAAVETAIPAFIGYTRLTSYQGNTLLNRPVKIKSLVEYEAVFGARLETFTVAVNTLNGGTPTEQNVIDTAPVAPAPFNFRMYYALQHYFSNGGGPCYVCSVGADSGALALVNFQNGLAAIGREDEPTLLLFPDAVGLSNGDFYTLMQDSLSQCNTLQDRFALVDVFNGNLDYTAVGGTDVINATQAGDTFTGLREGVGTNNLKYGAAYYPWLETLFTYNYDEAAVTVTGTLNNAAVPGSMVLRNNEPGEEANSLYHQANDLYHTIKDQITAMPIILPPSAAVAGIYAAVDRDRGVWKAPANVSVRAIKRPSVAIDSASQEDLNVTTSGKSVNAIRSFTGKGHLVWGARTLAGNDNEWRYVPVRRFFNMVEESVKKASEGFVFEPNDAGTWNKIRAMIENFLTLQWRAGALAGAKPEDAFYVRVGLGQTMTSLDVLEGRMIVEIGMAAVRPAEFIILRFSHKMQES
ncbi:MAG: phage tail sheath family protein [Bacteroidia bacterium]